MKEDQLRVLIAAPRHQMYNHSPRTVEMVKLRNQKTFRRNPCKEKQGLNQGSGNEGVQRRQMCPLLVNPPLTLAKLVLSSPNFSIFQVYWNPIYFGFLAFLKFPSWNNLLMTPQNTRAPTTAWRTHQRPLWRLLLQEAFPDLSRSRLVMFP